MAQCSTAGIEKFQHSACRARLLQVARSQGLTVFTLSLHLRPGRFFAWCPRDPDRGWLGAACLATLVAAAPRQQTIKFSNPRRAPPAAARQLLGLTARGKGAARGLLDQAADQC